MKLPRGSFLHLAAGAVALPVIPRIACAQSYPTRPVRLIVTTPAGLRRAIFNEGVAAAMPHLSFRFRSS